MTDPARNLPRLLGRIAAAAIVALGAAGCVHTDKETAVTNPYERGMTFAVAPVLNFSGDAHFDPVKAADLLASELTYVEGVSVLPVSRVVAYLTVQGKQQIESPAHALAVAQAVGADAIWVAAVTEYDPFTPVVGLAIQIYSVPTDAQESLDPVLAERMARPISPRELSDPTIPRQQLQLVYNGTHANVADAVRRFATPRSEQDSPLGWKEYLKVQTLFLRFCWHDAIDRLMCQERWHRLAATTDNQTEQSQ